MQEIRYEDGIWEQDQRLSLRPGPQTHLPRADQAMRTWSSNQGEVDEYGIPLRQQTIDKILCNSPRKAPRKPDNPLMDAEKAKASSLDYDRGLAVHRRAPQAEGPFTRPNTGTLVDDTMEMKLKEYQRGSHEVPMASAPPTIPPHIKSSGPLGRTTMVDLIEKYQNKRVSALMGTHKLEDSQTLMKHLEEYDAKRKFSRQNPSSSTPPTLPKHLNSSLETGIDAAKCVSSIEARGRSSGSVPSSDDSIPEAGQSDSRKWSQTTDHVQENGRPPSLALAICPPQDRHGHSSTQIPFKQVRFQGSILEHEGQSSSITSIHLPLEITAFPESDSESMADRRRRLLESSICTPLKWTHDEKPRSTPTKEYLFPISQVGHESEGQSSSTASKEPLRVKTTEKKPLTTFPENHPGPEATPSSASTIASLRYKTQGQKHSATQSRQSTSSESDLAFVSSTSGQNGLSPASSLEKLAGFETAAHRVQHLRVGGEPVPSTHHGKQGRFGGEINCDPDDNENGNDLTRAPSMESTKFEFGLLPEINSGDLFDPFQTQSFQDVRESEPRSETHGNNKASEAQATNAAAADGSTDEDAERGRRLRTNSETAKSTRSFSFSSAETVIRVSSRRRPRRSSHGLPILEQGSKGNMTADSLPSLSGVMIQTSSVPTHGGDNGQATASERDSASDRSKSPVYSGASENDGRDSIS